MANDLAFCFTCMAAAKEGKILNSKIDGSFLSTGFCNWKDATSKFLNIKTPTVTKRPWKESWNFLQKPRTSVKFSQPPTQRRKPTTDSKCWPSYATLDFVLDRDYQSVAMTITRATSSSFWRFMENQISQFLRGWRRKKRNIHQQIFRMRCCKRWP